MKKMQDDFINANNQLGTSNNTFFYFFIFTKSLSAIKLSEESRQR